MRRLAQALLQLRHYLPPALAPAGQSLTKIETLRLAIRYIAHLSALLGLRAGAPPDLPGDPLLDTGLMLPEFVDAGTVTQELSADLLSLLEALVPPQYQD
ncbi:hypothetical protein AV530_019450 [Patagioenas fasciata monilis]|uniref:BHLH domain-containing protein n=1 Tax=Patagioenas fasciata monilis TaxID=372326 RepID=A0A1V4JDK7_PATFA|nr:hypothetical protein AV530_019450 [Patagioenas fasciata monilis]